MGVDKTGSRPSRPKLETAIGRLDLVEFAKASKGLSSFAELEKAIEPGLGRLFIGNSSGG
jgi:hypothetical protein